MYALRPGTVDDIAFNQDGTLKAFLRLSGMDLADNHKWQYALAVQARQEGRLTEPALMVMLDQHAQEDFLTAFKIPPPLTAPLEQHITYTREHLSCTDHLAPTVYRELTDEIIVVYPGRDFIETLGRGARWGPFTGILKETYYSGLADRTVLDYVSEARRRWGTPLVSEGVMLKNTLIGVKEARVIPVTFVPMERLAETVECTIARWEKEKGRPRTERQVYSNLDLDYFFTFHKREAELLEGFAREHRRIKEIATLAYTAVCTSTESESHMPGVRPEETIPTLKSLNELLTPASHSKP